MADSTQSDADKIRAKRLAKLGAQPPNSTATSPSAAANGAPTPPQSTSISTPTEKTSSTTESSTDANNPFTQLGMKQEQERRPTPQLVAQPQPILPAKRERSGSRQRQPENVQLWQDRTLRSIFRVTLKEDESKDIHGHELIFLGSTQEELSEQTSQRLTVEVLEGAITEAAGKAPDGKHFEYLLGCFKRASRALRNTKFVGPEDPKRDVLAEAKRLAMSYCVFVVTMPEMFSDEPSASNPLVDHLLADPECDTGICTDFLTEVNVRLDGEDPEDVRNVVVGAAEELSIRLAATDMLSDYQNHVRGLRNLLRFSKIVDAITKSDMWAPADVQPQEIETKTLLGPFFRLSPMQDSVAQSYFSAPKTRDRNFISNAQNAVRMTLRTHQAELFSIADTVVRASPACRERILNWFALCMNKNHKKRAMRVDYSKVSSDGFMVNVTNVLDQLCEPFMDARFGKIERIDVDYLRRNPRVDISDETKINADQKASDDFYAHSATGTSNFISEVFFLTVAAHHYGTEAAQTRTSTLRQTVKRYEKDLERFEADRHKYINDPRYLTQFERGVEKMKKEIDGMWSAIHATHGVLLDDLSQARSMQFMRYVIVWLLRLASGQDIPREQLKLPLPSTQPEVFKCLPEYFLEDIVDNFEFITSNIPHIITPQQSEEIVQYCVTFLRNSEYVKNPGVKSGLVKILYYGCRPMWTNQTKGVLADQLISSPFSHQHLLHALMKYYIEAENTGTHNQFFDKFNIRYEIFQVIKTIWVNTMYRENLQKEASINRDFFVQFVNMILNDATFVLDESLSSFVKIHDLSKEVASADFNTLDEEHKRERQDLLEDTKGKAKSYMQLTKETMETLKLFTENLADAFTMPEIVQRLADMLDYNLDLMVGSKSSNLKVDNPAEYGFHPKELLIDIIKIYMNLSVKQPFIGAIAKDGRSYKQATFARASDLMKTRLSLSPEEVKAWIAFTDRVAETKAAEEQEEEDLGDVPEEYLDPLVAELMTDPVILPLSKETVDRSTIRSHLLSDASDPFNRAPLNIADVVPNTELREKIEQWKAERKAARAAAKAQAQGESMDTTEG